MTTRELLRRTPFRLAATFTGLFALTGLVLFAVLYVSLRSELMAQTAARLDETLAALAAVDRSGGFNDLIDVVESESMSVHDNGTIFLLIDDNGGFRAGNVRNVDVRPGLLRLEQKDLAFLASSGERGDDAFLAKWQPVSQGRLLVGESDRQVRRTEALLINSMLLGLLVTSLLAAAFAALMARRTQRRLSAINHALAQVSEGHLGARIALSRSKDDIDDIAAKINTTLGKLQTLVANVNQASSDISHDLKKPITRLHNKLERALNTPATPQEFRTAIDSALLDLESIVDTFEALLRITQIEAGARRSRFQDIDLAGILTDVADIYQPVAEDASDQLKFTTALTKGAMIRGDRELLIQMFANVIENAIRHCPHGTNITVSLSEESDRYLAAISDTGPGIPEREQENVFRRLYRLEASRSTPGNGLGLALVAAIADLHGATTKLEDNAPGLKVLMSFPRRAGAAGGPR